MPPSSFHGRRLWCAAGLQELALKYKEYKVPAVTLRRVLKWSSIYLGLFIAAHVSATAHSTQRGADCCVVMRDTSGHRAGPNNEGLITHTG